MILDNQTYANFCETMPLLCVDVIVRHGDQWLLVERADWPRKGEWWVPGGRLLWGEAIVTGAKRLLKAELSTASFDHFRYYGIYEETFRNRSGQWPRRKHTVSVLLETELLNLDGIKLDSHSTGWRLSNELPTALVLSDFHL